MVVAYRRRCLAEAGEEESLAAFKKLADMEVDWDAVQRVKEREKADEEETVAE